MTMTASDLASDATSSASQPAPSGIAGKWFCRLVDQEQSDDESEEFGDDDYGFDAEPQKASKTEFAGATLVFNDDETYRLEGADDSLCFFGTWKHDDDGLELTEHEDCINGYDGLEYTYVGQDTVTVGIKLIPDAHDGLDILVLTFSREPEPVRGTKPDDFVGQILFAEDEEDIDQALEDAEEEGRDPVDLARDLWDAVVDGRLAHDPESEIHYLHTSALGAEIITQSVGGFNHDHAIYCLGNVDYDDNRDLADLAIDMISTLAPGPRDAELAPLLPDAWLDRMVSSRFLGGGAPEELYHRALFPQPRTDDACREYMARSYYTRFEAFEHLFPEGQPSTAAVLIQYRGKGLLHTPLALLRERDLVAQARDHALAFLQDPAHVHSTSRWQSACIFGLMLSFELGEPVPEVVFTALSTEGGGMTMGSMNADEKADMRNAIGSLPKAQRDLVTRRLFLDG